jgi:flagellar hook-associated protein FlgK
VSLDTEATNITQLQRDYDANAQVVSVIGQLSEVAVNLISNANGAI